MNNFGFGRKLFGFGSGSKRHKQRKLLPFDKPKAKSKSQASLIVNEFGNKNFDPTKYVDEYYQDNPPSSAQNHISEIQSHLQQTSSILQSYVYSNHSSFVHASSKALLVENELVQLSTMMTSLKLTLNTLSSEITSSNSTMGSAEHSQARQIALLRTLLAENNRALHAIDQSRQYGVIDSDNFITLKIYQDGNPIPLTEVINVHELADNMHSLLFERRYQEVVNLVEMCVLLSIIPPILEFKPGDLVRSPLTALGMRMKSGGSQPQTPSPTPSPLSGSAPIVSGSGSTHVDMNQGTQRTRRTLTSRSVHENTHALLQSPSVGTVDSLHPSKPLVNSGSGSGTLTSHYLNPQNNTLRRRRQKAKLPFTDGQYTFQPLLIQPSPHTGEVIPGFQNTFGYSRITCPPTWRTSHEQQRLVGSSGGGGGGSGATPGTSGLALSSRHNVIVIRNNQIQLNTNLTHFYGNRTELSNRISHLVNIFVSLLLSELAERRIASWEHKYTIQLLCALRQELLALHRHLQIKSNILTDRMKKVRFKGDIRLFTSALCTLTFSVISDTIVEFNSYFREYQQTLLSHFSCWVAMETTKLGGRIAAQLMQTEDHLGLFPACLDTIHESCKEIEGQHQVVITQIITRVIQPAIISCLRTTFTNIEYYLADALKRETWDPHPISFHVIPVTKQTPETILAPEGIVIQKHLEKQKQIQLALEETSPRSRQSHRSDDSDDENEKYHHEKRTAYGFGVQRSHTKNGGSSRPASDTKLASPKGHRSGGSSGVTSDTTFGLAKQGARAGQSHGRHGKQSYDDSDDDDEDEDDDSDDDEDDDSDDDDEEEDSSSQDDTASVLLATNPSKVSTSAKVSPFVKMVTSSTAQSLYSSLRSYVRSALSIVVSPLWATSSHSLDTLLIELITSVVEKYAKAVAQFVRRSIIPPPPPMLQSSLPSSSSAASASTTSSGSSPPPAAGSGSSSTPGTSLTSQQEYLNTIDASDRTAGVLFSSLHFVAYYLFPYLSLQLAIALARPIPELRSSCTKVSRLARISTETFMKRRALFLVRGRQFITQQQQQSQQSSSSSSSSNLLASDKASSSAKDTSAMTKSTGDDIPTLTGPEHGALFWVSSSYIHRRYDTLAALTTTPILSSISPMFLNLMLAIYKLYHSLLPSMRYSVSSAMQILLDEVYLLLYDSIGWESVSPSVEMSQRLLCDFKVLAYFCYMLFGCGNTALELRDSLCRRVGRLYAHVYSVSLDKERQAGAANDSGSDRPAPKAKLSGEEIQSQAMSRIEFSSDYYKTVAKLAMNYCTQTVQLFEPPQAPKRSAASTTSSK